MNEREVAYRIFAQEFKDSTLTHTEGEREPNYLITPLGAKINRVFLTGVLTECENRGSPEEPLRRAKIVGPTGNFYVDAGQYQPEASQKLASIEPPQFVAVIGKARTYEPEEGTLLTSVRCEHIAEASEEERNRWVAEAVEGLKKRLEVQETVGNMDEEITEDRLKEMGYDERTAEGVVRARKHYGVIGMEKYEKVLKDALGVILGDEENRVESGEKQEDLLSLIKDMGDENGAPQDEIMERAEEELELSEDEFNEALDDLREEGDVYEPVLGNLRAT